MRASTRRTVAALARAAGSGRWVSLSPETFTVLKAAVSWAERSGGAFDPTVGPLVDVWGFHGGDPAVPSPSALAGARAAVGWEAVQLDTGAMRARLQRPGARLDFGAIAKGYALDRAVAGMREAGAVAGMVDLGGNVSVFGPTPSGAEGWTLGIRHPREAGALLGTLTLSEGSVATSGDYERGFEAGGMRYGHVLDPRSGAPVRGISAVTVAAPDGMRADALSTLLFVLGPEAGRAFVADVLRDPRVTVMWVRDVDASPVGGLDVVPLRGAAGPSLDLETSVLP